MNKPVYSYAFGKQIFNEEKRGKTADKKTNKK